MFSRLQPEDGTFVCLGYYLSRVSAHASPGLIHTAVQGLWFNILQKKEEWFIVSYGGPVGLHNIMNAMSAVDWRWFWEQSTFRHSELLRSSWDKAFQLMNNSLVYKQHEIIDFNFSLIKLWLSNGRKKWWCSSGSSLVSDVSSAVQSSAVQHSSLISFSLVPVMSFLNETSWTRVKCVGQKSNFLFEPLIWIESS